MPELQTKFRPFYAEALHYLGQALPYDSLLLSIDKIKPRALVTSWVIQVNASDCEAYFTRLRRDTGIPVFGGGIFLKNESGRLREQLQLINSLRDLELLVARCKSMQ